jgi:hypothetical protein
MNEDPGPYEVGLKPLIIKIRRHKTLPKNYRRTKENIQADEEKSFSKCCYERTVILSNSK